MSVYKLVGGNIKNMKREQMKNYFIFIGLSVLIAGYGDSKSAKNKDKEKLAVPASDYEGTASITQGMAKITEERIYECERGRKTDVLG